MKIYLFFVLCLVNTIVYSQVPVEDFYENGVLKSVGYYNNNKKEGIWKFYDTDGKLSRSGSYINGKMNGIWNNYYNNGAVSSSVNFDNDRLEGESKYFHQNGTIKEIGDFKNDLKEGVWKTFDENGKLISTGKYEKDAHEGEWKAFYANGQLHEVFKFTKGALNGDYKGYYDNGTLSNIGKYADDYKIGPWTYYHPNGQVKIKENYGKITYDWDGAISINKTGEWNSYYDNGQLNTTGYYDNNKQTGPWEYFGEKGNIILKGSYKNGARIGEWIAYYNNGNPVLKGKYQQDVINGISIPKSIGTWISYWEDGSEAKHYDFDGTNNYIEKVISTKFNDKYIYANGDGGYGKGETVMSLGISSNYEGKAVLDFEQALQNFGSFYRYGKWEEYTKDGWKFAEGEYNWKNNKPDGLWTYYNSKGSITATKVYKDGKLNGLTVYFRENGQKSSEVTMVNDFVTATTAWDENGKISEKSTGDGKGSMKRVYYFPNGNIKSFGSEVWNNKEKKYARFGNWTYNFENGNKQLVEIYKDGALLKIWEQYLRSGEKILFDGNGEYRIFYNNGQVSFVVPTKNGARDGIATWYYDNGQVEQAVLYQYDEKSMPIGKRLEIVSSFHKDGRIREKGTLKNGNGTWINYNEKGEISVVDTYKNGYKVQ